MLWRWLLRHSIWQPVGVAYWYVACAGASADYFGWSDTFHGLATILHGRWHLCRYLAIVLWLPYLPPSLGNVPGYWGNKSRLSRALYSSQASWRCDHWLFLGLGGAHTYPGV